MRELSRISFTAVWDPVVRSGHWALVAAFCVAYLSAEEEADGASLLHVWGGYAVGAIVALRMLWGFVGTQHARFRDFAFGPLAASRYVLGLLQAKAPRYIGHSPAGAVMIFALLACLAATVGTGLVANGSFGTTGLPAIAQSIVASPALADSDRDGGGRETGTQREADESMIGEVHGFLANLTLALIVLHVLGVGVTSMVHRENLVAAMITGRKRNSDRP